MNRMVPAIPLLCLAAWAAVTTLAISADAIASEKKVYADYHPYRYTREHDGTPGLWKYSGTAAGSALTNTAVNWNPDVIDARGRHQIASRSYPAVGMQSMRDPDYLEYTVLLAKAAGLDGFIVESMKTPTPDPAYEALAAMGRRYGLEVGVVCNLKDVADDGLKMIAYLLATNLTQRSEWPVIGGHPLVLLWHGTTAAADTVQRGCDAVRAKGVQAPCFFRWILLGGLFASGSPRLDSLPAAGKRWLDLGVYLQPWVPSRLRPRDGFTPDWDRYATAADAVAYQQVWQNLYQTDPDRFPAGTRMIAVTPGCDNRACAGWGRALNYIPRNEGETYRRMWEFAVTNRESFDIVFLATWNDFTEGTHLEPTEEEGDRELRTTWQFAAQFKGFPARESCLDMPRDIFRMRKRVRFLSRVGLPDTVASRLLDEAAAGVAVGDHSSATALLTRASQQLTHLEERVSSIRLDIAMPSLRAHFQPDVRPDSARAYGVNPGLSIVLDETVRARLASKHFEATVVFEYEDNDTNTLQLSSAPRRDPVPGLSSSDYGTVCNIRKSGTGLWKKATVRIFKENVALDRRLSGGGDFRFAGSGRVRDASLVFSLFDVKQ
jgi:hypothetical protein